MLPIRPNPQITKWPRSLETVLRTLYLPHIFCNFPSSRTWEKTPAMNMKLPTPPRMMQLVHSLPMSVMGRTSMYPTVERVMTIM